MSEPDWVAVYRNDSEARANREARERAKEEKRIREIVQEEIARLARIAPAPDTEDMDTGEPLTLAEAAALGRRALAGLDARWSDNVPVSMVGAALRHAQNQPAGDNIDRGLALIEALKIKGFEIRALATQDPNAGDSE